MGHVIGHGRYTRATYPKSPGAGGGATSTPLSRQRFIDGDTSVPGPGAASAPFPTIAAFIASRGNASVPDATANYVGWLMPALGGYTEDIHFPAYASTELRADSFSEDLGTIVVGNAFWANVAGANAAAVAVVALHNITVAGSFTVTDDGGAPGSAVIFGGDEAGQSSVELGAGFDSHTTTLLQEVVFENAIIGGGGINAGTTGTTTAQITGTVCHGDVFVNSLTAIDSTFDSSKIEVNATGTANFSVCKFSGSPVLTALAGATFDGPSWQNFLEAGGTRAAGTIVLVVGGRNGGSVEGAALTGATTNVSLNGTGATAGYTGESSGNHYTSSGDTPTLVNLLGGGGERVGDTLLITRTTLGTGVLQVASAPSASVVGVIPANARGFILSRWDGSKWVFVEGGSLLA
jgi:hypothetical protein